VRQRYTTLELSSSPRIPPSLLPALPAIRVRVARDRTAEARATGGFLNLSRLDLVITYPDGVESEPFAYDAVTRAALDAVVIAAHFVERGIRHVYLRSAVRPPCALRDEPPHSDGNLWEVPAGLVEPGEDPADTAARELGEELGFAATGSDMRLLGPWTYPVPAMIAERHVYYAVEVDPGSRATPTEDGSPLERAASIRALPLQEVLDLCRAGAIRDAKTELAARRLAEGFGDDGAHHHPSARPVQP
jgi:ADP-ribose pyrophosphatase